MTQNNNAIDSTVQPTSSMQPVSRANKKRSWLRIILVVVVILGAIAAFRIWNESQQLDKMFNRVPGPMSKQ